MTSSDLFAVNELASRIHPAFPEDAAVFAERLRLYPAGCHVLERGQGVEAYVISHPWLRADPPLLNSMLGELPPAPSTFYIHDLALAPGVRGSGAAADIVGQLAEHAQMEGFSNMSLIAVNGSAGFWQRQGFEALPTPDLAHKLHSYGEDVLFMVRKL